MPDPAGEPTYERIYTVVRAIPPGKAASYGQIAAIVGSCTARMVGYAMAALPNGSDVPWHRVLNAKGGISPRGDGLGPLVQRERLEEEGIAFDGEGRVHWPAVRWEGPPVEWLLAHGYAPVPRYTGSGERGDGQPSLFDGS